MAPKKAYQAYSQAIQTTPKTKQVVMLYDGAIRFIKQAQIAIAEKRIEDRFNLLLKASKIMDGLRNSLDFDTGGEVTQVAHTLHKFYAAMSVRILSVNFSRNPAESTKKCEEIIDEIQQMRNVWDNIDRNLVLNSATPAHPQTASSPPAASGEGGGVIISA